MGNRKWANSVNQACMHAERQASLSKASQPRMAVESWDKSWVGMYFDGT